MIYRFACIFTLILCCVSLAVEKDAASDSAVQKNGSVISVLEKIEVTCAKLDSFTADMNYVVLQPLIDTKSVRTGKLFYVTDDNSVLAKIYFDSLAEIDLMDDEAEPEPLHFDESYYFDGLWVVRSNALTKTVQRWEVSEDRQNREAFRLGRGPFPLPFAIKKDDVLKYFEVESVNDKADKSEQAVTVHLKLKPQADSSYAEDYKQVDLWVSAETYLPVKIKYVKQDYEQNTVTWSNIKTGETVDKDIFEMPKTPKGWTEEITPLSNDQ